MVWQLGDNSRVCAGVELEADSSEDCFRFNGIDSPPNEAVAEVECPDLVKRISGFSVPIAVFNSAARGDLCHAVTRLDLVDA
jgi:hypothetical protein